MHVDLKRFVGYVFAYVNKAPKDREDLLASRAIIDQLAALNALTAGGISVAEKVPAWSTNRTTTFASSERFRKAVQLAREENCALAVADLCELLSRTRVDLIAGCVAELDGIDVPIFDATRLVFWSSLAQHDRRVLQREATIAATRRSHAIKSGMAARDGGARRSSATNQKRAAKSVSARAAVRAEAMRPFVEKVRRELPAGAELTPSVLQKALNKVQILSPRGKLWSVASARNLLKRLSDQ